MFLMFFIKLKKTCFYVFYLQINVFNIYDITQVGRSVSGNRECSETSESDSATNTGVVNVRVHT